MWKITFCAALLNPFATSVSPGWGPEPVENPYPEPDGPPLPEPEPYPHQPGEDNPAINNGLRISPHR